MTEHGRETAILIGLALAPIVLGAIAHWLWIWGRETRRRAAQAGAVWLAALAGGGFLILLYHLVARA